jgi:prepilin-type N-terminal cleavage/methylation domain-containing protein
MTLQNARSGFSLLEMSLVLVAIGLLAGGVVAGTALIRASELRSVAKEAQQYRVAVGAFKEKYNALPGDMKNATRFWGRADNGTFAGQCADPVNNVGTGTQTCNGDGNGRVAEWTAGVIYSETFRFWQHLANAELIGGKFTGIIGPGGAYHSKIGVNSPRSKFSPGGWTVEHAPQWYAGSSIEFAVAAGQFFEIGAETSGNCTQGALFTPEEAFDIDKKIDDGRPGLGKITAIQWDICTLASSAGELTADYDFTNKNAACALWFGDAF